ncbi:putative oxidoreductase [Nymphon striatum]|nr:putative oxidoreductase [Nymphon striatum]
MGNKKTAWIIGASSGIGKSLAKLLAKNNWKVAISSRNQSALETVAHSHSSIHPYPLDITDLESLANARDKILDNFGHIDTLFLNAGDYSPMPADEFNPALFEQLISINYLGVVNGLDTILPYMKGMKTGEIYVTASLAGYRGLPKSAPYNASKAAVINLTESLHLELKQQGITLRLINPGFVKSPLTDKNNFKMPFIISPEKAAEYIVRELPKNNFEITFPKRFAYIMKMFRVLPYQLYFALTKSSLKTNPAEEDIFSANAHFKDPFNDVHGIEAIKTIFSHMFATTEQPTFSINQHATNEETLFIQWQFSFHRNNTKWFIDGTSMVTFNEDNKVKEHIDYWDPAEQIYSKVGILKPLMNIMKSRLTAAKPTKAETIIAPVNANNCPVTLDFNLRKLAKSEEVNLCNAYKGKVVMIVNTASKCGFTGQFDGLEALYKKYKEKGLVVLGFPSNDFANQDPENEEKIAKFYSLLPASEEGFYPIRTVSEVTGVNAITLRAWERRYGLFKPQRTPKGHRLYSQQDILRIQQVLQLLEKGVAIGRVSSALKNETKLEDLADMTRQSDANKTLDKSSDDSIQTGSA